MFSNVITFYTDMNNTTEFNALTDELLAFQRIADMEARNLSTKKKKDAVLVARLLPGIDIGRWRELCRNNLCGRWCALPVGPSIFSEPEETEYSDDGALRLGHMLLNELLTEQIQRELLRLSRTGGELAILEATIQGRDALAIQLDSHTLVALEAGLVTCLTNIREECDSLGVTSPGRYVLLLPGVGILHARLLAEDIQKKFQTLSQQLCPLPQDCLSPTCAVGIVCTDSHAHLTPSILLQQCEDALSHALTQQRGHISIAGGEALEQRRSLVHSSEKRFLFFGSN